MFPPWVAAARTFLSGKRQGAGSGAFSPLQAAMQRAWREVSLGSRSVEACSGDGLCMGCSGVVSTGSSFRVQEQSGAYLLPAVRCVENLQSLGKELQAVNAHRERSSAGPEEVE